MEKIKLQNYFNIKRLILAYFLGLIMLVIGGWDVLKPFIGGKRYAGTYLEIFLISLAYGTASLMSILFPILSSIPTTGSYRDERDSGFLILMILKKDRAIYRIQKMIGSAVAGFLAITLPCVTWYLFTIIFLKNGDTSFPMMHGICFSDNLYTKYPFLYGMVYIINAGLQGSVFSLLTLGISAVIKNKYVAFLVPFAYCIFSASILETYSQALNAITLFSISQYRGGSLGYWGIMIYDIVLAIWGITLFLIGDMYAERK